MELWSMLLGEHDAQLLSDPVSPDTYMLWRQTAANNTRIYKSIFDSLEDSTET